MPEKIIVRDASLEDFSEIVALNQEFVNFTSPMDHNRLTQLDNMSCYHKVVEVDKKVVGFILVMPANTDYDSTNYRWFNQRYNHFLYIDRVVVANSQQGKGLGKLLYQKLFLFAKEANFKQISCEFDIQPPNPKSAAFHKNFGFVQVGTQAVANGKKTVSLQVSDI